MYEKIDDGILLCKMINLAAPDTIDERVINTGKNISIFKVLTTDQIILLVIIIFPVQQHENLTLAINSAKAIGCVVIGIDSHTLNSGQVRVDTRVSQNAPKCSLVSIKVHVAASIPQVPQKKIS